MSNINVLYQREELHFTSEAELDTEIHHRKHSGCIITDKHHHQDNEDGEPRQEAASSKTPEQEDEHSQGAPSIVPPQEGIAPDSQHLNSSVVEDVSQKMLYTTDGATNPDREHKRPSYATQVLVVLLMSWAMCGVAHSRGFPGVVLPQFTNPDTDDLYLDPPNLTLFVSIVNVGVMVGSLVTGQLLAPLGGRVVILIGLPLGVIAWIGLVFSYQLWVLMLCRLLMGFAFALVKPSTVMYIVEVADERIRGRLVGVLCIAREIGFSSSYFMGSLKLTWRQLSLLYGCFLIPPIIALFFIPDSPRWLVARGRVAEACKSLKFFRGCHYDVEVELEGIVSQASAASNSKSSFWQQLKFLARPPTLQTFILLCTLFVIFAFQGIVTITPYLMIILDTPGTPLDPADSAVMCSFLKLSGIIVHIFLIDFIGRKPIFVVFLSYISVCNIVYGFSYTQLQEDSGAAVSWLPLISIGVLHFFSGIIVPVIDLVQGELLPTACRAVSLPLLMLSHSLAVFISLKTFLQMVDTLGMEGVFRLFTLVNLAMAVLTIVAVPETRCMSLEAISNGSNSQARPNTTVSVVIADSHDQRLSKNIVSNQGDNSSSTSVHSHSTHLI